MVEIGSVALSDSDYVFVLDAIVRMRSSYTVEPNDIRGRNFLRRLDIIIRRMEHRRPTKSNN